MTNPFEQMFRNALDDDAEDDTPTLTHDQIEAHLTTYHALVHAAPRETFAPGQVVWFRAPDLTPIRDTDQPHLFVSYLEAPIRGIDLLTDPRQLGMSSAADQVDCRVASLYEGSVSAHLLDSRQLTATRPTPASTTPTEASAEITPETTTIPATAAPSGWTEHADA